MNGKSIYEELGIDPGKHSVREIFGKVVDNKYPGAFVNIVDVPFMPGWVMTQHQDGDGSKSINRMIYYLETGDSSIFEGMVDDAFSMNTGDIAAAGFVRGDWFYSDVLNVNLSGDLKDVVLKRIAKRFAELKRLYKDHGIGSTNFLGGETADLPDQVKPNDVVFDLALSAFMPEKYVIKGNVRPGDAIYGFASDGRAVWESHDNSGIMSNGLTMARRFLTPMSFNEKYRHLNRDENFYKGRLPYDSVLQNGLPLNQAVLSPTRQWAIVIKKIIERLEERNRLHMLHGIVMNTGGGATKIGHLGTGGICYHKNMPEPPEIFRLIQDESGEKWNNMFQSFNCGVGIDVVGEQTDQFTTILGAVSVECSIKGFYLGDCEEIADKSKNIVRLNTPYGEFPYNN